ncbi:maleylacetoacetate isomerase [Paraburkholderia sp. J94]|uniref:maleylacetoacetate isomerase n=1 Tax=Paraburkholderia sp. J94 TaxID=2805441 RepID=UPI002AAF478E|nr:maleylacetoacetate isomerase [Paraburkholderia sp. J94]
MSELFSFFNSSASYRVRIALGLKGIAFDTRSVNIRTGAHREAVFVDALSPMASVPALREGDFSLSQSLAIIDWLDARYPTQRLIPLEQPLRARVLELSYAIACDIHPVNNLRILKYLEGQLDATPQQKDAWYRHWIKEGMCGIERLLSRGRQQYGGPWCFGKEPTLADCCLIPQIANAKRFGCDLADYPIAMSIFEHAASNSAFVAAAPDKQPDFVAQ